MEAGTGQEIILKPSAHANGMASTSIIGLWLPGGEGERSFELRRRVHPDTRLPLRGQEAEQPQRYRGALRRLDLLHRSSGGCQRWPCGERSSEISRHAGVFRISPDGKKLSLVTADFVYPNGLCFSPDESLLYVNGQPGEADTRIRLKTRRQRGTGRLFHRYTGTERGNPDGIKVDIEGNVYCTGRSIYVHDTDGHVLARMKVPGHPTNFGWGDDDWRSLYVTTLGSVVRLRLNIPVWHHGNRRRGENDDMDFRSCCRPV